MGKGKFALSLTYPGLFAALLHCASVACAQQAPFSVALSAPIVVYSRPLAFSGSGTISLADRKQLLRDIDQLTRLRGLGVRIDYDVVNIPSTALADAPDALRPWLVKCRASGVRPGFRFPVNTLGSVSTPAQRSDLLASDDRSLSLSDGSFLAALVNAIQVAYDHGIRYFELDSLDHSGAAPAADLGQNPQQVSAGNAAALVAAVAAFRS